MPQKRPDNTEIMYELGKISQFMEEIPARFDRLEAKLRDDMAAVNMLVDDHEKRMRRAEQHKYWFSGFSTLVGTVIGAIAYNFLGRHS